MHNESRLLGHVRYPCNTYNDAMQSLVKVEKEGKPRGKNPPPKREINTKVKRREKKTSEEEISPPRKERREKREVKGLLTLQHPAPPRDLINECT